MPEFLIYESNKEIFSDQTEFKFSKKSLYVNNLKLLSKKIPVVKWSNEEVTRIGFGFFFWQGRFLEECLPLIDKIDHNLHGHYCIISYTHSTQEISIKTDTIGLFNIYYHSKENLISNSPELIKKFSKSDLTKDRFGKINFLLNESFIGNETFFKEIRQIPIDCELILNHSISFKTGNQLKIPLLSEDEYIDRIIEYFKNLNKYKGCIGVDGSAGYDTRLIIAISNYTIKQFTIHTNNNKSDFGIDIKISKLIAKRINKDITIYNSTLIKLDKREKNFEDMYAWKRNIHRSKDMSKISVEKYRNVDLLIGGYGGEVVRKKYTDYKNKIDFIEKYFKAKLLWKKERHSQIILNAFNEIIELISSQNSSIEGLNTYNLAYALMKMRNWGGGEVFNKNLIGYRLHPFMDWHLLGPLLVNKYPDRVIDKLINYFEPRIKDIPINPLPTTASKKQFINYWDKFKNSLTLDPTIKTTYRIVHFKGRRKSLKHFTRAN